MSAPEMAAAWDVTVCGHVADAVEQSTRSCRGRDGTERRRARSGRLEAAGLVLGRPADRSHDRRV